MACKVNIEFRHVTVGGHFTSRSRTFPHHPFRYQGNQLEEAPGAFSVLHVLALISIGCT
jgi:hypothetical protein